MANITVTNANTFGFLPEIWAQMGLDLLKANLVMARLISRDTDYEPGWKGKQLNVRVPGTFTANKKAADTPAVLSVPAGGTTVPVTLSEFAYVDFLIEDIAQAQANVSIMTNLLTPAVQAIAEQIETDVWTKVLTVSGSIGTFGTDLSAATIRSAKKALTDNRILQNPRYLVMSTKDEIALLGDDSLTHYFANAKSQAITEGALARIYGFDLFVSQLVPVDTVPTPDETSNVAFHPGAFVMATRPLEPPPPGSGVQVASITDEQTGLTLRVLVFYSVPDRGIRVGVDVLYGVAKVRDEGAIIVKS